MKTLSTLKALTALLFWDGWSQAFFSASSSVPRVFPVKFSIFLLSIAFSCTGTLQFEWDYIFCEGFSLVSCVLLICPSLSNWDCSPESLGTFPTPRIEDK